MKVWYRPNGGRFGYGFDYFCAECDDYVGNSSNDKQLKHRTVNTTGIFTKTVTPLSCSNAGKVCEMPRLEVDAKELSP